MSFKDEIISAIQTVTVNEGDNESIAVLGPNGSGWERIPGITGAMQRLETMVTGYANTIPNQVINRGKPFSGSLNKEIRSFIAPYTVNMEETYGIVAGDTFNVTGSINNDQTLTVSSINGNLLIVDETVINETFNPYLSVEIDEPLYNLNIEETIRKIQADIYDSMPREATATTAGTVKKIAAIEKFNSFSTDPVEIKFNELIDVLRNAGSMSYI